MNILGFELPKWFRNKSGMSNPHPFAFTPMLPMAQTLELIGRIRAGDMDSHRTFRLAFGVGGCVNELRARELYLSIDDDLLSMDALLSQVEYGLESLPTENADVPDWLILGVLMVVRRVLASEKRNT